MNETPYQLLSIQTVLFPDPSTRPSLTDLFTRFLPAVREQFDREPELLPVPSGINELPFAHARSSDTRWRSLFAPARVEFAWVRVADDDIADLKAILSALTGHLVEYATFVSQPALRVGVVATMARPDPTPGLTIARALLKPDTFSSDLTGAEVQLVRSVDSPAGRRLNFLSKSMAGQLGQSGIQVILQQFDVNTIDKDLPIDRPMLAGLLLYIQQLLTESIDKHRQ